ncbi:hypothetical protein ACINNAV18_2299 [Acinetobacter baumannii Naval-18]|nr:hypothetical protein ACINNAV18_2299 [Acinetobacter baumannii Naval-18]
MVELGLEHIHHLLQSNSLPGQNLGLMPVTVPGLRATVSPW